MVARGYASLSFLHQAAVSLRELDVPAFVYHLGDFDPSGVNAGEKIEETLRDLAPEVDIHFERLAVTPKQISAWSLPSRPTKQSDSRSRNFGDISVELDAIAPGDLRSIVEDAIRRHLSEETLSILKDEEQRERKALACWAAQFSAT